jgi:hypothetical protein
MLTIVGSTGRFIYANPVTLDNITFQEKSLALCYRPEGKTARCGRYGFARGPAEMASTLFENRRSYMPADFSLHVTEVALAIHNTRSENPFYDTKSTFAPFGSLQESRF